MEARIAERRRRSKQFAAPEARRASTCAGWMKEVRSIIGPDVRLASAGGFEDVERAPPRSGDMLPSEFPEVQNCAHLQHLLLTKIDMQFKDLRAMLQLPTEELEAGCNFPAAITLLNIVGGVSVLFFNASLRDLRRQQDRHLRFDALLAGYYPWQQEEVGCEKFLDILWSYTRNPLTHALGVFSKGMYRSIGGQISAFAQGSRGT